MHTLNDMARPALLLLSGTLLAALAVACASADGDDDERTRFDGTEAADAGAATDAATATTPTETSKPAPPAQAKSDAGASKDAGAPVEQKSETTCREPKDLGMLAGDDGNASTSTQGKCSEWVRVRLVETYQGVFRGPMRLTATLVSPQAEDFDLVVYLNKDSDVLECNAATEKSELPGNRSDVVKLQWGEEYTANSSDDSRTASIEVRNKKPGCAASPWTLLLQGNY